MIITKSFLRNQAEKRGIYEFSQKSILDENKRITEIKKVPTGMKYDLFLSHSSLDKTLVLTLVKIFNDAGYSVYVDWINDKQLDRSAVSSSTANTLKLRLLESNGLSYIATQNTMTSKWCPWELGLADGMKSGRACILPILDNSQSAYHGQEYLGIYPYLEYAKEAVSGKDNFWVYDNYNSKKYVILSSWLRGSDPVIHE